MKIKKKKEKKCLEMSIFYTSAPTIVIIWYTVPEIWRRTYVIVIFHFGLFFALLPPNLPQKWKIKKKWKKYLEISFYTSVPKIMIICNTVPEIWHVTDVYNCYFSFWAIFFSPFTPLIAQKIKISKKWKSAWRFHHFTHAYQKLWFDDVLFLRNGVRRTDRWMEKMTHRGGCPT